MLNYKKLFNFYQIFFYQIPQTLIKIIFCLITIILFVSGLILYSNFYSLLKQIKIRHYFEKHLLSLFLYITI